MTVNIETLKQKKKELGLSYDDLAKITGYSRSTITNIFCGYVEYPRVDTMETIERALGITNERADAPAYTEDEKKLLSLISELTEEEAQELSNYIDFIISKRK